MELLGAPKAYSSEKGEVMSSKRYPEECKIGDVKQVDN